MHEAKQLFTDAEAGNLPNFSILTPTTVTGGTSQHNGTSMGLGDEYIAKEVKAIQEGPDGASTTIFIYYDDCGCFYDHVKPPCGPRHQAPARDREPVRQARLRRQSRRDQQLDPRVHGERAARRARGRTGRQRLQLQQGVQLQTETDRTVHARARTRSRRPTGICRRPRPTTRRSSRRPCSPASDARAGRDDAPRCRQRAGAPDLSGPPFGYAARRAMKVLVLDNYDSFTYNLVQYLGELGAEVETVRNDRASVDELLARGYERCVVSPGPVHAERGRHLAGGRAALSRGGRARRSACASATRRSRRRSAARSSSTTRSTARRRRSSTTAARSSRGCAPSLDRRALPLAGRRRRAARLPGGDRARRRRADGAAPPRAARRGRPVPPRVGPDRTGARAARRTSWSAS